MCHSGTDRTEKHTGETAAAVTSDDDQLSLFGFLDQPAGWLITGNPPPYVHIRILFLPAGEAFAQQFVTLIFVFVPVHAHNGEDSDVAPGVERHQVHPSAGCFVESQSGGRLGCR